MGLIVVFLIALATLMATWSPAVAQQRAKTPRVAPVDSDQQALAALRGKRDYAAAEKYCTDLLAKSELPADRRANLTIELSRTYAEHAAAETGDAAGKLWGQARAVVDDFAVQFPQDPRLLVVRAQGALAWLAEGELARQAADFSANRDQQLELARGPLRSAIASLRTLEKELAAELVRRARAVRPAADAQRATDGLSSLALHVHYHLARALRNQGLAYPPGTTDRLHAFGQASALLKELAQHNLATPLGWSVRLDEITCHRLLGAFHEADEKLIAAEKQNPPDDVEARLQAERIRLALDRGQIDDALSEAGPPGAKGRRTGEASNAQLEAYLAGRRRALEKRDDDERGEWERAAVEQVRAIEAAHDPAWSRRAEALLAHALAADGNRQSAPALLVAAQSLYRGGQPDEALAAYDRAAKLIDPTDAAARFDAEFPAAVIEYERGNFQSALDRFKHIAEAMSKHDRASEAHLLAIHCAAKLAESDPSPQLDAYEKLLGDHVTLWPDHVTTAQAWWRLGRLKELQGDWQEAIKALAHVPADDPQYSAAVAAIGRAYDGALSERRRAGNPNEPLARDAVKYFEGLLAQRDRKQPLSAETRREATLAAARIYVREIPGGAERAERLLTEAQAADPKAPADWQQAAEWLLAPALAGSGQLDEASKLLAEMPLADPAQALAMAELLADTRTRSATARRAELGRLELTVLDAALAKGELVPADQAKLLARRKIATLTELDRRPAALKALSDLAKRFPRDGSLQEELAEALATDRTPQSLRAAAAKWGEVAAKSKPGSERWFRAHAAVARAQLDLGHAAQARSTVKLVETSHPDFGGPAFQPRFRQLLAECEQSLPGSTPRTGAQKK